MNCLFCSPFISLLCTTFFAQNPLNSHWHGHTSCCCCDFLNYFQMPFILVIRFHLDGILFYFGARISVCCHHHNQLSCIETSTPWFPLFTSPVQTVSIFLWVIHLEVSFAALYVCIIDECVFLVTYKSVKLWTLYVVDYKHKDVQFSFISFLDFISFSHCLMSFQIFLCLIV